jgi:alpha-galactosidase
VYRRLRAAVARSTPVWLFGLPGWRDPWIAGGARDGDDLYLAVWHRAGREDGDADVLRVPLPAMRVTGDVAVLYPTWGDGGVA